jgi:hypothetical protein
VLLPSTIDIPPSIHWLLSPVLRQLAIQLSKDHPSREGERPWKWRAKPEPLAMREHKRARTEVQHGRVPN